MSEQRPTVTLEEIVSLCKRRGFIFQGSEIYGGLAGTWDYGPLGVTLKKNLTDLWWKTFVENREDMVGVDAAILMNPKTWKASGHVDTFNDPVVECHRCFNRFRVDKILDLVKYNDALEDIENALVKAINEAKSKGEQLVNVAQYIDKVQVEENLLNKIKQDAEVWGKSIDAINDVAGYLREAKVYTGLITQAYMNDFTACPECSAHTWTIPGLFNLMYETSAGLSFARNLENLNSGTTDRTPIVPSFGPVLREKTYDLESVVYLRPETAQGIFTNYKNVVDTLYPDVPFGIAQIGKAFRNEISPRDFVFRSREFNQMEIEYFIHESQWEEKFEQWRLDIVAFLKDAGVDADKVKEVEVAPDDLAHYSKRTIDYEFAYPHGHDELLGLAYRTNFDLRNIERESGKKMEYRPKDGSEPFVPHVIEPSFGVERLVMAVLVSSLKKDVQNGEERIYLALPEHIAPVKFCVSPLLKNKSELVEKAREVYAQLKKKYGAVIWDDNGNIGKRYRRQDEIGTPHCVVIDFQTLEDGTVTVRDRDTTEQSRVSVDSLL